MRNMSKKTLKLRVRNHMTEMQKLDAMLKKLKVPHTYDCRFNGGEQVIVYSSEGLRLWDGICCEGSYGFDKGLIEVMGPSIVGRAGAVEGWLTARQVTKMWRDNHAAQNR